MSTSSYSGDSSGSSSFTVNSSTNGSSCVDAGVIKNRFQVRPSVVVFDSRVGEDHSEPLNCGVPGFMLGDKSPRSVIRSEDLAELRANYAIPICASLAAPSHLQRPDWYYPGWAVMYECFFQMGARFPLPRLVLEACHYYSIVPSQLVPNAWRVLMAIQVFSELRGVHFSFPEILLAYSLEMHRSDKVRYQFKASRPLVLYPNDSPKDWSCRYFFVSHNALGEPPGVIIPWAWEACCCPKKKPSSLSKNSSRKIEWFLGFDEEERRFSTILTEENLRASSLWSHVPADHHMSKTYCPPLLGKGAAMEMLRNRKKNAAGSSGANVDDATAACALPPSPAQVRRREKRPAQLELSRTDQLDGFINLSFPNISAHSQFTSVCDVAEKLLLPNDVEILKKMGDGDVAAALFEQTFLNMQKAAFLKERTLAMVVELRELKAERAGWRKEMAAIKKAHDEAGRIVKKLELAKLEDARRLELAAMDCKALQDKVVALERQILYESCETEVRVRGEMALAFLEHQPPETWDVQQYIDEFNEWKAENEQEGLLANKLAVMTTGGGNSEAEK